MTRSPALPSQSHNESVVLNESKARDQALTTRTQNQRWEIKETERASWVWPYLWWSSSCKRAEAPRHLILLSQWAGSQSTLAPTQGLGRKWRMKLQNSGHNEVPVTENYPQAKEGSGFHGSRLLVNRKCLGETIKNSGSGVHEGQTMGRREWGSCKKKPVCLIQEACLRKNDVWMRTNQRMSLFSLQMAWGHTTANTLKTMSFSRGVETFPHE